MPIKVLLADDSEIMRRGMRQLLSRQSEIAVVGEASNFAQTILMARDLAPQLIVMDLHMPTEGDVTMQEVKSRLNRGSQVLAISIWTDEDTKDLAESVGAVLFLDKMDLGNTLVPTIMRLKGERPCSRVATCMA